MGLRNLPSKTWAVNCGWVLAANIATDLSACSACTTKKTSRTTSRTRCVGYGTCPPGWPATPASASSSSAAPGPGRTPS